MPYYYRLYYQFTDVDCHSPKRLHPYAQTGVRTYINSAKSESEGETKMKFLFLITLLLHTTTNAVKSITAEDQGIGLSK